MNKEEIAKRYSEMASTIEEAKIYDGRGTYDLCRCKKCVGERYERATILFEGTIYDWVSHECCSKITHELKMFDGYDDNGLNSEGFRENINEYVSEFHYDDELDDISKDWQLPYHELVKKVLEELKKEESNE